MDKPATNRDGSTDIYFGPQLPTGAKNWIRTLPQKGYFVIVRIYGPTQAFFDKKWRPDDIVKLQ
jgi:hypothetical protein